MQISVQYNNSTFLPSIPTTLSPPPKKKPSLDILGYLQYFYIANNNVAVLSCIRGREWFALFLNCISKRLLVKLSITENFSSSYPSLLAWNVLQND